MMDLGMMDLGMMDIIMDDFFTRALIAGVGVALVAGPLGCIVVWRRLAYFGDTLSHAALVGVALALLLQVSIPLAVFGVSLMVALMLFLLQRGTAISADAILGLLSHTALAMGLVVLAFMSGTQVDLLGLLFGDILAVSVTDIVTIYLGGGAVLLCLALVWRPLFAATVSPEIAEAEGGKPSRVNLIFTVLMAGAIAIALKIVGALLITALLIIPAAAARRFARGPEMMAVLSSLIGAAAVILGLNGSLAWDTPSGPSIVLAAVLFFLIGISPLARLFRRGAADPSSERAS